MLRPHPGVISDWHANSLMVDEVTSTLHGGSDGNLWGMTEVPSAPSGRKRLQTPKSFLMAQ